MSLKKRLKAIENQLGAEQSSIEGTILDPRIARWSELFTKGTREPGPRPRKPNIRSSRQNANGSSGILRYEFRRTWTSFAPG